MKVIVEFDDCAIAGVNESVKSYDMDFYDIFEDALSIGFDVLGLDGIHQYRVEGLRDRDLDAYRVHSQNYERWLNDSLLMQSEIEGQLPA
jgi:hypothetical protein